LKFTINDLKKIKIKKEEEEEKETKKQRNLPSMRSLVTILLEL
jgi:hypothetical protein